MNILINGGSKGMGRATALKIAEDPGYSLIVTGRDESALRSLSGAADNKNIHVMAIDTAKGAKELEGLKNHLLRESIKLDAILNFTGLLRKSLFAEATEPEAREMFEVNFFGPVLLIREMLPFMARGSHIVNIGSMGGVQGSVKFPGLSLYSASKAALASMSESLAVELAPMEISVNCLCPGAVDTDMFRIAFPGYTAPISADGIAQFIAEFALRGHRYFNGKILPVSRSTP
ncbi:MAG: SDR family oxidoreductase [Bacteroidales bacterium]|jgi:short-subunit dehydrogenase|nr:SDR family oxidoreductase [Bacteroidales bacterium]